MSAKLPMAVNSQSNDTALLIRFDMMSARVRAEADSGPHASYAPDCIQSEIVSVDVAVAPLAVAFTRKGLVPLVATHDNLRSTSPLLSVVAPLGQTEVAN